MWLCCSLRVALCSQACVAVFGGHATVQKQGSVSKGTGVQGMSDFDFIVSRRGRQCGARCDRGGCVQQQVLTLAVATPLSLEPGAPDSSHPNGHPGTAHAVCECCAGKHGGAGHHLQSTAGTEPYSSVQRHVQRVSRPRSSAAASKLTHLLAALLRIESPLLSCSAAAAPAVPANNICHTNRHTTASQQCAPAGGGRVL